MRFKRLPTLLADALALLIALWALARARLGDGPGALAMINAWHDWLITLGLAAAGHGRFYGGQRPLGLALLGAALIQALRATGTRLPALPRQSSEPPRHTDLRVLTNNLLYRVNSAPGLLAAIEREQPDVVFLQELTHETAAGIAEALGDDYPHRRMAPSPGSNGFGLLSRHPLGETELLCTPGGMSLYAQRTALVVDGRPLDLYNCHLMPPLGKTFKLLGPTVATRRREAQIEAMLDDIAARGHAAIVAGDFNLTPSQAAYRRLSPRLTDSWTEAGRGPGVTWPLNLLPLPWTTPPLLRIDFCCHTAELQAREARVIYTLTGSDHAPIVVDLAWAQPGSELARRAPSASAAAPISQHSGG